MRARLREQPTSEQLQAATPWHPAGPHSSEPALLRAEVPRLPPARCLPYMPRLVLRIVSRFVLRIVTKLWIRAYKQAWTLPSASDGSPMILSKQNGGRNCPDATEVWIRAAIDVLDQCICLPGEISMITVSYLHRLSNAHGCHALNQLQHLFRVGEIPESTTELLLLRFDEHGMELSSPWSHPPVQSIIEVLWPYILNAWLTKERWAGCTELDEDVQLKWKTAKLCLQACKKLGSAKTPILTVSQLYNSHGQWSPFADLRQCICQLSREEHTALINCL
jgi:hypothetical protein